MKKKPNAICIICNKMFYSPDAEDGMDESMVCSERCRSQLGFNKK